MARSNEVKRTETIDGIEYHVFDCTSGHEFNRVVMRGVKPFECPEHAPVRVERKPREVTPESTGDNGSKRTHHMAWPELIGMIKAHTPAFPIQPYLFGEAGTGKTYTAGLAAKTLGMEFRAESCSIGGTEVDFFGFIDANGNYHRTAFRDVWQNGGIFLADELDKASPYVLSKLNNAFASGTGQMVEFPDGPVPRHADCIIIGAGNTDMRGGTERFHTSQPVDAATMTRFQFIKWDFDEEFEFTLVDERHHSWVKRVHSLRKAVNDTNNHAANINVSPRAILAGAALKDATGWPTGKIEDACVWQYVSEDTKRTIQSSARTAMSVNA